MPELARAIAAHQVVIVAGETGSGKTTQLPKLCLAMGRGADGARIGCTQPRRIAATSVAARVAHELGAGLGDLVGYQIRFTDRTSRSSRIKFMTDGIALAELQRDPLLRAYDTLIVDEAHERSLNIDFLLGILRRVLPRRPDLRVIVSSATLETERFAKFFGDAPVVSVSGRTFPVDVLYRPPREDEPDLADAVANTVDEIVEMDPRGGDILVFLPGEREIREAMGELEARALPHAELLPLYARLSAAEQQRVFVRDRAGRRVVLATNVAETSLTIPGIAYVVDTGLARINRYDPRTGVSQLLVEDVSRASADQRKGRCGRVQHGVCFRLYEETDYATRPAHTDPEIKRVSLAGVILRMKSLGLGELAEFPLLDPPSARAIRDGAAVLEELGALDDRGDLSEIGHQLARLPLDPRLGRMILGGRAEGALREVVIIAAALGLRDPRDRPQAAQQQADEAHRAFRDDGSDFAGYLKMWAAWREAKQTLSRRKLQQWCRDRFLSYVRMREWDDIHEQIVRVMKELDFAPNAQPASADRIHRALAPGLLSKIGMYVKETRNYLGARQTRFVIHPSSGLAKKPPAWVMGAELVETSQLFARTCAKIDPAWLEELAGPLCRRSHGDPHWEQKAAQVVVREQVSLYGLPIVRDRSVPYARYDRAKCRELFIEHALVRGEFTSKGRFLAHNQHVQAEAQRLRDKARTSDMFTDDSEVFGFFDRRLPPDIVSGKAFEAWRSKAEASDAEILYLSLGDLIGEDAALRPTDYPDELVIGGAILPLSYRFEPSEDDDGVTATVPLAVLPQLDPEVLAWTIRGWHRAKLVALLESLPKAVRKTLGPLDELAAELAAMLVPFSAPMLPAIERAILERRGERVARDAWDLRAVPAYLALRFRVVDTRDKVLGEGRDLVELQRLFGGRARELWAAAPRVERTGLRAWDFDALPATVEVDVGGRRVPAYPALVDAEHHVDVRLLESAAAAEAATREGLRRLYLFGAGTSLGKLEALVSGAVAKDARKPIVVRALDDAFALAEPAPRDRAGFAARLAEGRARLHDDLAQLGALAMEMTAEHVRVRTLLVPLGGKPGLARAVVDDVATQLSHLAVADLVRTEPRARLVHAIRYLRAIVVRLQRQAHDPQKDSGKAAQVVPLWQAFTAQAAALRAKGRARELDDFGWLLEELRVAVFAPELKTAVSISPQRASDVWRSLCC